MKKLALNIDDLRVDSFEPAAPDAARGTVVGNGTVAGDTCAPSCPYTCGIIPQTADCRAFGRTMDCPVCA
jgi:predicted RNA-binding Zn-ribbon protein involved in translation (DUF1610 family)